MANDKQTLAQKQYLAKILYTREQLDGKIVATKVGVSENTISKWVNEFGWKDLRKRLLVSKDETLSSLYEQLEELNTSIKNKESGKRYSDSKEADIQIKLTASIRQMETNLAIADLVEAGIRFVKYSQRNADFDQVMVIVDLWDSFLQEAIKK